jgi:hypothetical protein
MIWKPDTEPLDFVGQSMIFWKDLEMFLGELERLFENEKEEIRS